MELGLKNKVAVITGASAGIGAEIAMRFAAEGCKVVICYLEREKNAGDGSVETNYVSDSNLDDALLVQKNIRQAGGTVEIFATDLSLPAAPAAIFDFAEKTFGSVNILINNAAHCELPDTILSTKPGVIDRHFSVNVRSSVLLIHEFAGRHIKNKEKFGRIINISTDAAQKFPTQISYGASKAALEAYTRSISYELGGYGITVNAIAPGPIQTGWMDSELENSVVKNIPLGRVGYPIDIAHAVLFLCSDKAEWITGQVLKVDGGHT